MPYPKPALSLSGIGSGLGGTLAFPESARQRRARSLNNIPLVSLVHCARYYFACFWLHYSFGLLCIETEDTWKGTAVPNLCNTSGEKSVQTLPNLTREYYPRTREEVIQVIQVQPRRMIEILSARREQSTQCHTETYVHITENKGILNESPLS
jgi:hypothetical protein